MSTTNSNILNLFKLQNLRELSFVYQLVKVELPRSLKAPSLKQTHWNAVLFELASQTKGPVGTVYEAGVKYAAIKAYTPLITNRILLAPQLATVSLVSGGVRQINYAALAPEEVDLAQQFLYFYIREQLSAKSLWKYNNSEFFVQQPTYRPRNRNIEVYEGFNFKLKYINKEFYIGLDLAHRYTDRQFLHERIFGQDIQKINNELRGKRLLYFNGNSVYPVEFKGIGKAINVQRFRKNPEQEVTVYDYIRTEGLYASSQSSISLIENCPTLLHTYTNRSDIKSGATCFAKLVKTLKDEDARPLQRETIYGPQQRFERIQSYVRDYFQTITFNGVTLSVNQQPLELVLPVFKLPTFKYKNDTIFDPLNHDSMLTNNLRDFGKVRKQGIYQNGILTQNYFGPNYLFMPESLGYQFAKSVKYNLDKNIRAIAKNFEGLIIVMYDESDVASAYKQFKSFKNLLNRRQIDEGAGLFILPDHKHNSDRFLKDLHDCLKKEYYPNLRFQFASANRFIRFFQKVNHPKFGWVYDVNKTLFQEYKSYLSNLLFELLIINYKWLYALQHPLNYDIYVGIDAHDYYAGFCFFYRNGEQIVFDYKRISKGTGTFRNEKINAELIADVLEENLKEHIPLYAPKPNGIILLRDGISFGEEEIALREVLARYSVKQFIPEQFSWGVVDVKKQSSLTLRTAVHSGAKLENPVAGTYFLNESEGYLFNTGYPFKTPGSSKPLSIVLTAGENIEIEKVCQDIYYQSLLAFSAPEQPSSLPVPIKLIDTLIRSFAHRTDESKLEKLATSEA
ncbi:hypothetical protein GCM10023189_44890 [Nibrella saemangeumensis]|uniref:Piwi domain-containing protein n=1 Tax=Nibrella saemangeumensis TaxID=1084526 RepID=A0ABP8NFE4_9BACT